MSVPSNTFPYCYAKFLVDIYPEDAIEILCERSACDIVQAVEQRVERCCIKLGGRSVNEIKGMIETRQWEELKALRLSPTPSALTPRNYRRAAPEQTMPPTPSSTASGSPQSQRKNLDWILVYHTREEPVRLTAQSSGSEHYLIGEDKLERFQGLTIDWTSDPRTVTLGGQPIVVAASVYLTWMWNGSEDSATMYAKFWVVRPELIRHADVLLGYKDHQTGHRPNKAVSSPLSLGLQEELCQASPAPTPPQPQRFYQPSSTAIHSTHGSPPHSLGPSSSYSDFGMPSHHPPRPSVRTDVMSSGSRSFYNPQSSRPPSMMEQPPSRPESVSSTTTAKPLKLNTVVVQLSFQGAGKKILPLDLTKNGDEIVPFLASHVLKMSGQQLDRSVHELIITPFTGTDVEAQTYPLGEDEIDFTWDILVNFILENRAGAENRKPEFRLDIRSNG